MSRNRTRFQRHTSGHLYRKVNGVVFVDGPDNGMLKEDICLDDTGKAQDHALTIHHFDASRIVRLNGDNDFGSGGSYRTTYTDALVDAFYSNRGHLGTTVPPPGDDAVKLKARTNPSRPEVTPLTLAQDMIELPKMIRDVGRLLTKPRRQVRPSSIASWNLAVQFGWLPLIHDVSAILNLQSIVDRRIKEMERLYSNGGLKRRLNLGSFANEFVNNLLVIDSSLGTTIFGKYTKFTSVKRWGTLRWLPTSLPPSPPGTPEFNQHCRNIVTGWTITGLNQGAWDLLPWSWLCDWFGNVGDYMLANSAGIPCASTTPNIMTESSTTTQWGRYGSGGDPAWITGGTGTVLYVSKERYVGTGSLSAHLPFLSAGKLSILGSLFAQRFRGL